MLRIPAVVLFAVIMGTPSLCPAEMAATAPPSTVPTTQVTDPVFDLPALLAPPLDAKTLKGPYEQDGVMIEEVTFHSHNDGAKSIDIFALFCYPKGAKALPAVVWNQGGLAQASPHWPVGFAKRGYASLCIDFPMPRYRSTGDYPIVSGLDLTPDPRNAPIYHGAVALLRAVSYLETRPEVDKDRIAMAGLSWGGFYTTLMPGIDARIKVGSAMFGCGELQLGNTWWDGQGWDSKRDAAFRRRWRETLDPAPRLAHRDTPMFWVSGTNDQFYWMPALMKTYEDAMGPKALSLWPNYAHALPGPGGGQLSQWLDVYLKGAPPFPVVGPLEVRKNGTRLVATWRVTPRKDDRAGQSTTRPATPSSGPSQERDHSPVSADVILSYGEAGNWFSRCWVTLPAKLVGEVCTAELPATELPYLIAGSVIDARGGRYSTKITRVSPSELGVQPTAVIAYDGCAEWGSFEKNQEGYWRDHSYPFPETADGGFDGERSAMLKPGDTVLKDVLFTPDIPHRLTCHLKADAPAVVGIKLAGVFDGKPHAVERHCEVGAGWTEVTLDYLPPRALAGAVQLIVTTPEGSRVQLDGVSFKPVME